MRAIKLPLIALAGATMITPAMAQNASGYAPPAGQDTTTAAPTTSSAPATVTDAEVQQFASAVVAVDRINKDASIAAAEKQPKMAEAVTASGLTPQRFNSIATAMNNDPALQQKVGAAVQAQTPAADAGASAGASATTEPAPTPAQ